MTDYNSIQRHPPPDDAAADGHGGGEAAPLRPPTGRRRQQQQQQHQAQPQQPTALTTMFRTAFSMDYARDDLPKKKAPLPTHYYVTTYMLLSTLFAGFALGFSVAFFAAGRYWSSEAGLARLGCGGGVGAGGVVELGREGNYMENRLGRPMMPTPRQRPEEAPHWLDRLPTEFDGLLDSERAAIGGGSGDGFGFGGGDIGDDVPPEQLLGKSLLDLVTGGGGSSSSSGSSVSTSSSTSNSLIAPVRPNVYLNHLEAYTLLLDDDRNTGGDVSLSPYSTHYFLLSSGLDVQVNQAYCAAATVAGILNSLRFLHPRSEVGVDVPVDSTFAPYSYATQVDVFGTCSEAKVISNAGPNGGTYGVGGKEHDGLLSYPRGLGLDQVAELLKCHLNATAGWTVTAIPVDSTHLTLSKMRYDMKSALLDSNARLLVNYHRTAAGQVGGGHFSPVGSYNPATDSFLVLDVARYKYPPVWLSSDRLFRSMGTYDECGSWDYPHAQSGLDEDGLRAARGKEEVRAAREILGCRRTLRGYIIARRA